MRMMSQKMKDLKAKLETEIHPNIESLIKAAAERHTVLNLGQNWPDPTYGRLLGECSNDEEYDAVLAEYKMWLKDAKKEATMVVKAGLPLTLESMELAFSKKGPFEKKGA
jgi:hypothetical protein